MSKFEVVVHEEAEEWLLALDRRDFAAIAGALDLLAEKGPALGRPAVDSVTSSRHRNMKELRSFGGNLRALFALDPNRQAVVLVGGDKTDNWMGWYEVNVPVADDRYDAHLRSIA